MSEIFRYPRKRGPKDWTPSSSLEKEEEIKVIFRMWPDGDVIALFPEIPSDYQGYLCESYMHVGQHGAADTGAVIDQTRPALPEEYRGLLRELGGRGYTLLNIMKRVTGDMVEKRLREASAFR